MAEEYKTRVFSSQDDVVTARNLLRERGLKHNEDYIIETLHDVKGKVSGYRLYYDLNDEIIVWMKIHGIIS
jgi:hypothetical protein